VSGGDSADDEFWDLVLEATWRHHMGEPVGALSVPPEEAASGVIGEPGTLCAAGGWCAPFDPDRAARVEASVKPEATADVIPDRPDALVPQLACGCPEAVLETGEHEPGCTVLDIPATSEGSP
jgi:hypothetical protein